MIRTAAKRDTRTDVVKLRDHLRDALREGGYGKLVEDTRPLRARAEEVTDWAMFLAVLPGYAAAMNALGIPVWLWPPLMLGLLMLVVAVEDREGEDGYIALGIFLLTYGLSAVVVLVAYGWEVVITHVAPWAIAGLVSFLYHRFERGSLVRTLKAVKSTVTDLPLLFPFIALVMFALILSTEIWQTGSAESPARLAILGFFVIVPLTWLLQRRLLREIDHTFAGAAKKVQDSEQRVDDVVARVKSTAGRPAADWIGEHQRPAIRESFAGADLHVIGLNTCRQLNASFERRITTRLLLTVVAVMLVAFLVIYALSWLMIDEDVAKNWIGDRRDINHLVVAGQAAPLGPYAKVAALLAILGTAIFMAFVMTTDSLQDFRNAYIENPAMTAILLVVPYTATERRVAEMDEEGQAATNAAGGAPANAT